MQQKLYTQNFSHNPEKSHLGDLDAMIARK